MLGENQKVISTFSGYLDSWNEQTHRICPFEHASDTIRFFAPQVAIVFCKKNEMAAQESIKRIREMEDYIHVIAVCETRSSQVRCEWLASGADDVIDGKIDAAEFLLRVQNQFRIRKMHDQILRVNHKLRELVDIDDLTGLYNMRSLYQKLDFEIERSRRFGRQLSVVMLDLDYFKGVNDGHDHLFGSFVLSEVGKLIQSNIRTVDIGARYGGDEFLIVLTEISHEGAASFCERLRKCIANHVFRSSKSQMEMTASIGFSMTPLGYTDEIDAKELVRTADQALYAAKHAGRNCVKFAEFQPDSLRNIPSKKAS
jgi:diguanylate cyclase (GGDEF)-like protein